MVIFALRRSLTRLHKVIMYYIETKAICCHPHFGQFLGSHQTLGGGGGRYFRRFYLAAFNAVLIARTTMTKYIIIISTCLFDLKEIYRNEYILIPLNFVATAAMHTIDRYIFNGRWPKKGRRLVAFVSIKYIITLCSACFKPQQIWMNLRIIFQQGKLLSCSDQD